MNIAIIGTGYVGLPTGVGFAELGHNVVCIDNVQEKISNLDNGHITLFEEGLEELFNKNRGRRLNFTTDISTVKNADFVIIAVGTPPHPVTKEADMKYIYAAAKELASHLDGYTVIANKSTVPVGTSDAVEKIIKGENPHADFDVVSMPEFLREGFAVHDFFNPDRIVIGTESARAQEKVRELYSVFPKEQNLFFTGRKSSELIKYASNAFLSVKIHYINEMADFCEKVGANVCDVAHGMGLDSRIGPKFLNPGPGYGGSCFPKDTKALSYMTKQAGMDMLLVEAAIAGNAARKSKMAMRILNAVKDTEAPVIAVWGLAFKDGTDDVRESPAIQIVQELVSRGANIVVYDPRAMETARAILGDSVTYAGSAIAAAKDADVLAVLTEWKDFAKVPLESLKMRRKHIIDLRHVIDSRAAQQNGFSYKVIGQ